MNNKSYPIGIQSFEKIRTGNYYYIDKTPLIYQLVSTGSYYFLNRPRRFGKSLLMSTIEAYFLGKRTLFEGLAMEQLEKDWQTHPVLHLDLNSGKYDKPDSLDLVLEAALTKWETSYGTAPTGTTRALRFKGVVERACQHTGKRVVMLVDEYDKPLLQTIGNKALQDAYRNTLNELYTALKTVDGCIRFALFTGVTKAAKTSLLNNLNNLDDISMRSQYMELCGISERELHDYLEADLHQLAKAQDMTYNETCEKLRQHYGGYYFTHNAMGMYNPFSLLNALKHEQFGNYWFGTGTPTYPVELLKANQYDLQRMANEQTNAHALNSAHFDGSPLPIINQAGYLTIKAYDEESATYQLGFPNKEVEEGLLPFLLPFYTRFNKVETPLEVQKFIREMREGQPNAFFHRLQSFFTNPPSELTKAPELHYRNVLFMLFKLVGFTAQVEYHASQESIDLVVQTDRHVYLIAFNLNGTAAEALQQIHQNHHADPFENDPRKLFKIGVNFSPTTRNIEKWIVE